LCRHENSPAWINGKRVRRLRADDVLAWRHPEQPILTEVVRANRLKGGQRTTAFLIGVPQSLDIRIAHGLAEAVQNAAGDNARQRHLDSRVLHLLLRGKSDGNSRTAGASLSILRIHISITGCRQAILSGSEIAKRKLPAVIRSNGLRVPCPWQAERDLRARDRFGRSKLEDGALNGGRRWLLRALLQKEQQKSEQYLLHRTISLREP